MAVLLLLPHIFSRPLRKSPDVRQSVVHGCRLHNIPDMFPTVFSENQTLFLFHIPFFRQRHPRRPTPDPDVVFRGVEKSAPRPHLWPDHEDPSKRQVSVPVSLLYKETGVDTPLLSFFSSFCSILKIPGLKLSFYTGVLLTVLIGRHLQTLFCVIYDTTFTDYTDFDLSRIFQFSFNLFGNISCQ